MEYKIVREGEQDNPYLDQLVNGHIEKGWKPIGGSYVYNHRECQAMIKEDKQSVDININSVDGEIPDDTIEAIRHPLVKSTFKVDTRVRIIDQRESNTYRHYHGIEGVVESINYIERVDDYEYLIKLDNGIHIRPFESELLEVVEVVVR